MNTKNNLLTALFLSIAGVLFAGYLTVTKLITGTCSFGESCPFLWNHPVCIYGLIIFFTVMISIISLLITPSDRLARRYLLYSSILGVLFSAYYSYQEVFNPICGNACIYKLGLPTCIYGFIVFVAVFICVMLYRKKQK
jgi:uncharacterized membrane protein